MDKMDKLVGAIEMNTQTIALLNRTIVKGFQEIKDMSNDMHSIRRSLSYLKPLVEIIKKNLEDSKDGD